MWSPTHVFKIRMAMQIQEFRKQWVSVQQSHDPKYVKSFNEHEVVAEVANH